MQNGCGVKFMWTQAPPYKGDRGERKTTVTIHICVPWRSLDVLISLFTVLALLQPLQSMAVNQHETRNPRPLLCPLPPPPRRSLSQSKSRRLQPARGILSPKGFRSDATAAIEMSWDHSSAACTAHRSPAALSARCVKLTHPPASIFTSVCLSLSSWRSRTYDS